MLSSIKNAIRAHQKYRQTVFELSQLTNRELQDLGISRSDIHHVARRSPN